MLFLTSADLLEVVTDSAATVDVHASWVDTPTPRPSGSTDTPGSGPTAISSATTTTIVAAPASGYVRNIRRVRIRNKSAGTSVTITVRLNNGTAFELEERVLGPGQAMEFNELAGWYPVPSSGPATRPWYGQLAGAQGDGDPGRLLSWVQNGSIIAATPTNISTSVARCCSFMLPFDMTVNSIRFYGVGATTNVYRIAIYRMSDRARLIAETAFTTASATWGSIGGGALGLSLVKDTCYFIACSVNATGTTAGVACMGTTVAASTGQVNTAPGSLPGSLGQGATNYMSGNLFQFAVTTGALPDPAATLAAQAAWTGGMPAFWLDAA